MATGDWAGSKGWRLPPLRGGIFIVYRLLWSVLALMALASLAQSYQGEVRAQRVFRAIYGLGLVADRMTIDGQHVKPFSPQAKHLLDGSELLVAVDGRPIPSALYAQAAVLEGAEGSDVRLLLQRDSGARHVVTVRRSASYLDEAYAHTGLSMAGRRWTELALSAFAQIFWIATGILLFVRRPHDPICAMLALGMVGDAVNVNLIAPQHAIGLEMAILLIVQMGMLLGLIGFPDGQLRSRALRLAAIVGAITTLGILAERVWLIPMPLRMTLTIAYFIAIGAAVLVRYRSTPTGMARQQIKFALLGFATAIALILAGNIISAVLDYAGFGLAGIGIWVRVLAQLLYSLGLVALAGGLLVSLLRYRLYDAESVISRSVAYGALTLSLLAIFAGSEKIIEEIGKEYLGHELGALAAGLGAAVAAILITPLHHRITHWAERRFQGALVHLRQGLPALVGDIRETATPAELADAMLSRVETGVRASHGAVVVGGEILDVLDVDQELVRDWLSQGDVPIAESDALHCDQGDPLFPMRVPLYAAHTGLIGWVLLGPRPDGSFYGKDEREALREIAEPTARALAIAIERQKRDLVRAQEIAALQHVIAGIQPVIANLQQRIERLLPNEGTAPSS